MNPSSEFGTPGWCFVLRVSFGVSLKENQGNHHVLRLPLFGGKPKCCLELLQPSAFCSDPFGGAFGLGSGVGRRRHKGIGDQGVEDEMAKTEKFRSLFGSTTPKAIRGWRHKR